MWLLTNYEKILNINVKKLLWISVKVSEEKFSYIKS